MLEPSTERDRSVRELDSFEEFFFYMEPVAPALHVHAVHLVGPTERTDWHAAWRDIHSIHPLLGMRVVKAAGKRPAFVDQQQFSAISIRNWDEDSTLESMCEEILARPFVTPAEEMVALTVLHRPQECLIALAAHHSLYDGMGTLLLLQDLLDRLAGTAKRGVPGTWMSLRQAAGVSPRGGYLGILDGVRPADVSSSSPEVTPFPAVKVRHLTLERVLTSRLEAHARANSTTPHGALMAAFQIAGSNAKPAWLTDGVHCNTPYNVRTSIPQGEDATGMLTMPLITRLDPRGARSFWEMARSARYALAPARSPAGRLKFIEAMDELTADEMTPVGFLQKLKESPIQYELMISDYASYRPKFRFGALTIISLATGNNGGGPETQTVGACTIDGALNLTQISRSPIEGLLDGCRDLLAEICA